MTTSIRDRLQAKLKKSKKRTITEEEKKLLSQVLAIYAKDPEIVEKQTKLLQETDDQNLVAEIFAKLEKDFVKSNDYSDRESAIEFTYILKDKDLCKKFEDYCVSTLKNNTDTRTSVRTVREVAFTGDKNLVKKVMAAIPVSAPEVVNALVDRIEKNFVDIAFEQFSQPQYKFLPLVKLLTKGLLEKDQADFVINSITKEGLDLLTLGDMSCFSDVLYPIKTKLAAKIIEVGWNGWQNQSEFMKLDFVVQLLLYMPTSIDEKLDILQSNIEFKHGANTFPKIYVFLNAVYLNGLLLQLKTDMPKKHSSLYGYSIR